MHSLRTRQQGFTAVELLITLFIAASFLIAGYQLFDVVIRDGAEARNDSKASNIAYDYLRRVADTPVSPCTPSVPPAERVPNTDGLTNIVVSVQISCPKAETPALSRIEVTVAYGTDGKSAKLSTLVDKSKGATPNQSTTYFGLVAQWGFNGNGDDSLGTHPLTLTNTNYGPNRTGAANSAIITNGTNSSLTGSTSDALSPSSLTISFWVNPTAWNAGNASALITKRSSAANGFILGYLRTNSGLFFDCGGSGQRWLPGYTPPFNSWTHLAVTCTSGKVELFVNGISRSVRNSNSVAALNSTGPVTIANDSVAGQDYRPQASFDDIRIYNRVLTNDEIVQVAGESL